MWEPDWHEPQPSFRAPIDDPGTEPDAAPFVCIRLNVKWALILAGCALQAAQPESWKETNPPLLADLLARATIMVNMIGEAGSCLPDEGGTVSVTILAGDGTASIIVSFVGSYATAPIVVCSTDDIALTASWSGLTTTEVTLHLTSSVPVVADTIGIISWMAGI